MNAKSKDLPESWVDPDDAPELTDEMLAAATWKVGARTVPEAAGRSALAAAARIGRPRSAHPKQPLTVRYDPDIIAAFKATGRGWQTRMNDALREWLKTHSPI